ncbi:hypothetical protein ACRALDRAFT_1072573 [Sodiomyces alcalophilus JCM 7366]|uniref:uncharacterized protein n=1 Tax=Sodiomyces alcalophilus JCM 7366 TaxID=591952 RepID=UPI0039B51E06
MDRGLARRLLAAPPQLRTALLASSFPAHAPLLILPRYSSSVPTIAQPEFWKSLIPKPFRPAEKLSNDPTIRRAKANKVKSKEWNPATFYIVIFLLIGSMSINHISLRQSFETFMRQSDVRIGLLREVIERVQRGEKVDIESVLGTGNPEKEEEWAEVLKEIERDDVTRSQRKERSRSSSSTSSSNEPATKPKAEPTSTAPQPADSTTEAIKTRTQETGMSSFF